MKEVISIEDCKKQNEILIGKTFKGVFGIFPNVWGMI